MCVFVCVGVCGCVSVYMRRVQAPHLNSSIPLADDASNVSRVLLLNTNSAMNLSSGVVTAGLSAHACEDTHRDMATHMGTCTRRSHGHRHRVTPTTYMAHT